MEANRPDPEQLLKRIQAEEKEASSAKLKVFFGPYPGVGKTYAMLEAARERKKQGVDVIAGVVETHGRPETAALLNDFEILQRKEIPYKGVILKEFDLDAALTRKPELILIDELAHTNAPNSRHPKRWQDVEELLDAGISVYTTLNVQHWESLNDVVAQITGVKVRETVPDTFLLRANEVELVDLPPADLLKRMSEGKVYMADQAIRAAENFFQIGNLIALRELALRHTAERVDQEMQEFKNLYGVERIIPVRERLLVGITASPNSQKLIRATLRLATSLRSSWITVYIQTPEHEKLPDDQKARIVDTLRLAERLGSETAVITGQNIPEELMRYARMRNVTKIVLGKPARPRWKEVLFGSTVNQIARHSGEIDLYVISPTDITGEKVSKISRVEGKKTTEGIWQSILLISLSTYMGTKLLPYLDRANLIMFYFLIVVWVSYRYGRKIGVLASIASALCFDFFLVPPYLTLAISDTEYIILAIVMLATALVISTLTGRLTSLVTSARGREERLRTLYQMTRTLSEIPEPALMLQEAHQQLSDFYKTSVLLLIPDVTKKLKLVSGDSDRFGFRGNELQAAEWVFRHGEMAGRGSDTLAGAKGTYIPLKGRAKIVGVLGILLEQDLASIEPEQIQLLETFATAIGGALESKELSESAGKAIALMESERLKNLVLRSFSFDLAAPAEQICEAANKLSNKSVMHDAEIKKTLEKIREKSDQISKVAQKLPQYLEEEMPLTQTHRPRITTDFEDATLTNFLTPERIRFFESKIDKTQIFEQLLSTLNLPDLQEAIRLLADREEAGGILIKPNVAIPHIRIDGIAGVRAALGIQQTADGSPFFWLLFVSGSDSIEEHLGFLRIAALTLSDEVLESVSKADRPEKVLKILKAA